MPSSPASSRTQAWSVRRRPRRRAAGRSTRPSRRRHSLLLTESEFGEPALGFLAQHLVVLLDPAAIVADLHAAYREPVFGRARYAIFMTGPSATADIEGVLIHGAQGVRSLTVVPLAAAAQPD
jgi:hypothetical protein